MTVDYDWVSAAIFLASLNSPTTIRTSGGRYAFSKRLAAGNENALYAYDNEGVNLKDGLPKYRPFWIIGPNDALAFQLYKDFGGIVDDVDIEAQNAVPGSAPKVFDGWYSLPHGAKFSEWKNPDKYTVRTSLPRKIGNTSMATAWKNTLQGNIFIEREKIEGKGAVADVDIGLSFTFTHVRLFLAAKYAAAFVVTFDVWPAYFSGTANRSSSRELYIRRGDAVGYFPSVIEMEGKPEGYTFAGWELKSGEVVSSDYVPAESVTIRARWVKTVEIDDPDAPIPLLIRTLTFNANGGTIDNPTKMIRTGEPYGELPVPERAGFDFVGWYTSPYGDAEEVTEESVMADGDVTVYAYWTKTKKPKKDEGEDKSESEVTEMIKIISKQLPHKVGTASIKSAELKTIAMQFMENFRSLHAQLLEVQKAVIELQGRDTSFLKNEVEQNQAASIE